MQDKHKNFTDFLEFLTREQTQGINYKLSYGPDVEMFEVYFTANYSITPVTEDKQHRDFIQFDLGRDLINYWSDHKEEYTEITLKEAILITRIVFI